MAAFFICWAWAFRRYLRCAIPKPTIGRLAIAADCSCGIVRFRRPSLKRRTKFSIHRPFREGAAAGANPVRGWQLGKTEGSCCFQRYFRSLFADTLTHCRPLRFSLASLLVRSFPPGVSCDTLMPLGSCDGASRRRMEFWAPIDHGCCNFFRFRAAPSSAHAGCP